MIVSLEKITKHYNGVAVLKDVAFSVGGNERVGLVGINGSGKSTLLKIIVGLENADSHSFPNEPVVFKNKGVAIGYLEQNSWFDKSENSARVYSEMREVFKELDDISEKLRELEAQMEAIKEHDSARFIEHTQEYSRLNEYFETRDGYIIDVKIKKVLNGMGFPPETYEREISTLSGGERTRLAIAKLLLENPSLLILDEPTNHLDFKTVIWLEDYLKEYKGALLVVSHDRFLLDKLCTSICELERGRLRRFKGNYSAYVKEKQISNERQLKEYEAQQQERLRLKEYIAANIARASTSNMAKSRVKKLEAMELVEKPVLYEKTAKIKFSYNVTPPLDILNVKDINVTAGDKLLLTSLSFSVRRGDKIGIIGTNGSGKSTLLKTIQTVGMSGIAWANNTKISYFDQENAQLNMNDTVIEAVHKKFRALTEGEIRSHLAGVRLTGDNVFKRVGAISGGERAKLCFALMSLERANVLILDEPTNHLDIATREVIENALCDFDGTVIFVSHDRYFLNKLATRIFEIAEIAENKKLIIYDGKFDSYIKTATDGLLKNQVKLAQTKQTYSKSKEQRAIDTKKRIRLKELETQIQQLESQISLLEAELSEPEINSDYLLLEEKCHSLEAAKNALTELEDEWLSFD
ncbi:MAG: ABC-F family ATP-binding cassette domain-containing protein [Oscillospiraceae bacterium]|nr:ABC-F family ATP-binding cassette domain-containing protein [Oscillospiraceae bacterium]